MLLNKYPVICLTGPTAVGKTEIAIYLAQILPCEVISVDSAMVYQGMDIGTAKPNSDILTKIPHHLIDIRDPSDPYSAGLFIKDVTSIINDSITRQRIPLLVGGTMLYFYSLYSGLAHLPNSQHNPNLHRELKSLDTATLYRKLKQYDLKSAQRIHAHDRQRIERALFVYQSTGQSLSQLQTMSQMSIPYPIIWIAIYPNNRGQLKIKIAQRFQNMLDQGLVKEVDKFYQRQDLSLELPACRAVGYRQIWDYLAGKTDYQTMKSKSITATCQLAKRQMTWLKKWPEMQYFFSDTPDLKDRIKEYIEKQLVC